MAVCTICHKQFSFIENLTNRKIQRCKNCNRHLYQAQSAMLAFINNQWQQRGIFAETRQQVMEQLDSLCMPADLRTPILARLDYFLQLTDIRYGNVPRISTTIHLDSDEYAHFEWKVIYFKPRKTVKQIPGRLIGTNKKCYFISDTGADSATIDWNNISQVCEQLLHVPQSSRHNGQTITTYQDFQTLQILLSKGSGGGGYTVPDILLASVMIDALVRLWKRQLVIYAETKNHGAIPEHVKVAVFQRDHGRCVQCGYEGPYIEYDHRIPRSKGGQNTVANIQLLCRMCNLKKGDRL